MSIILDEQIFEPIPEIDNLHEVGPFLKSYHILLCTLLSTTGINLPGMVSSPSQEEHGHFGFPVQETKSAPGEVVYPSMPGEEPPPPPPPRIREDEDAPPLPPRLGSAQVQIFIPHLVIV